MTLPQAVVVGLIVAQAIVNLPFLIFILKGPSMPVPEDIQAQLDRITTATQAIPAKLAAAVEAATAAHVADHADTVAALKAAADSLETAAG